MYNDVRMCMHVVLKTVFDTEWPEKLPPFVETHVQLQKNHLRVQCTCTYVYVLPCQTIAVLLHSVQLHSLVSSSLLPHRLLGTHVLLRSPLLVPDRSHMYMYMQLQHMFIYQVLRTLQVHIHVHVSSIPQGHS